jgi:hypothetical protein
MPKSRAKATRGSRLQRIVGLTEADVAAAQHLLALLGGAEGSSTSKNMREANRQRSIDRARVSLAVRKDRTRIFGESLSADPPFQILLALFVSERTEPIVTVTRLTGLASLTASTALRWLEPLARDGWITRADVTDDRRKAKISLTSKARKSLDELFGWPEEYHEQL